MKSILITFLAILLVQSSYAQKSKFETIVTHKEVDSFYSKVLRKLAENPQCDYDSQYSFRMKNSIGSSRALYNMLYKLYGKAKSIDELMIFIHVEYTDDINGVDMNMVKVANGQYESNVFTDSVGVYKEISREPCSDSLKSRLYVLKQSEKLRPCKGDLIIFGNFSRKGLTIKFITRLDRYTVKYLLGSC